MEHVTQTRKTLSSFAEELDIHRATFSSWVQHKGSVTSRHNLERIAERLSISVEDAILEAGGTAEGQLVEQARTMGAKYRDSVGTKAIKKWGRQLGRSGKGKSKSEDHIKKVQVARAASGGKDRADAARLKANKSIKMQIVHSMCARLMTARRVHKEPTPEDVRRWIHDVSETMSRKYPLETITPATLVPRYLGPFMKKHGLRIKTGRPRVGRHRWSEVETLMAGWPRDRRGNLANGFWSEALRKVREFEGDEAPKSKESLRQWWLDQAV